MKGIFFQKKYNFLHFERHFAFQNALNYIFFQKKNNKKNMYISSLKFSDLLPRGLILAFNYDTCSKISNNFLFLFSNKMLVIRSGSHKVLVWSLNYKQRRPRSNLFSYLSKPFGKQLVFEICEHVLYSRFCWKQVVLIWRRRKKCISIWIISRNSLFE